MTIGVSCTAFSAEDLGEWIGPISEEFDHWEIFSDGRHHLADMGRRELKDLLSSYDLTYTIHTAIADVNIASLNDRMRKASLDTVLEDVALAPELGVDVLTVHPGIHSLAIRGLEERSVELAAESMKVLDKAAEEYGVTIAIENMPSMPYFIGRTAEELEHIIEGTGLGVCFDVGHANTIGQIDEMVNRFGGRIVHMHVHDNMGDRDAHMTIGDGNIRFGEVLRRMSPYDGCYIIESKTFESAVTSRVRLGSILGSL